MGSVSAAGHMNNSRDSRDPHSRDPRLSMMQSSHDEAEDGMNSQYAHALAAATAAAQAQGHGLVPHRVAAAAAAAAAAAVAMRDEGAILRRAERARERALRGPRTKGANPL